MTSRQENFGDYSNTISREEKRNCVHQVEGTENKFGSWFKG